MKTNAEIRRESWGRIKQGKWILRFFVVAVIFGGISEVVNRLMLRLYVDCGIQTWSTYLNSKIAAASQDLLYTMPSSSMALQMHIASLFSFFIAAIFSGITYVALASVNLKAARNVDEKWFSDAFSNFARPFGLAWLFILVTVKILMWSLLFIVPGIVAAYRYSQVWNLKADNPEWSASKCIDESSRIMKGLKMQRFRLDISFLFWWVILLMFILTGLTGVFEGSSYMANMEICPKVVYSLLLLIGFIGIVLFSSWMLVARAVFYRAALESVKE
jgi:uncharacterized membrane protein